MRSVSVKDLFAGTVPVGNDVVLKGWVKTRRDSKQGFSFINLHDGSCFDAIQVVADKSLPNYEEEILHLTTGCAIVVRGELVESSGRNQKVEVQAKAPYLRASARSVSPAPANQYHRRHYAPAPQPRSGRASLYAR